MVLIRGVSVTKYNLQQKGFRLAVSKKPSGNRTETAVVTNLKCGAAYQIHCPARVGIVG